MALIGGPVIFDVLDVVVHFLKMKEPRFDGSVVMSTNPRSFCSLKFSTSNLTGRI